MTTATMPTPKLATATEGEDWNEVAARFHAIDGAIRRKIAGTQSGADELLLDQYHIVGRKFDEEKTRLAGVASRKPKAGDPQRFEAAVTARDRAADALATQEKLLGPQIEQMRAKMAAMQKQLAGLRTAEEAAQKTIDDMQASRKMLETLLPAGLKAAVAAMERPVRQKYSAELAAARHAVSLANIRTNGDGKLAAIQAAEAVQRAVEERMNAELETVAREQRDFYYES
jgi:hypothetical protein